jgi:hypothetical protein
MGAFIGRWKFATFRRLPTLLEALAQYFIRSCPLPVSAETMGRGSKSFARDPRMARTDSVWKGLTTRKYPAFGVGIVASSRRSSDHSFDE